MVYIDCIDRGGICTIVAKKADDSIVAQGDQVEGVAQEKRDPVVAGYERQEDELDDVEEDPDGEEGSDGDLFRTFVRPGLTSRCLTQTHVEAISKLQHILFSIAWPPEQPSLPPPPR